MLDFDQLRLEDTFWLHLTMENASWEDPLLIPAYVSLLSAVTLLVHAVVRHCAKKGSQDNKKDASGGQLTRFQRHIKDVGGLRLFLFRLTRLIACMFLVVLSLATSLQEVSIGLWTLAVYLYASWLAILSIAAKSSWTRVANGHLNVVLLAPFFLLAYRDLWPLATYHSRPIDEAEGTLLWAKVVCLTFAATVIPLAAPRKYVPINSEDTSQPRPEHTASWLSLAFHSYNDSLFVKAFRLPHLKVEELPALSESDKMKYLTRRSFQHLDPLISRNKRHIGLKLIFQVFPVEHLLMFISLVANSGLIMAAPIGINHLLSYLETGGKDAFVRPWFWVLWILVGNILSSLCMNWFTYVGTMTLVECQAIVTQLIFDHALRICVKSEIINTVPVSKASSHHPSASTSETASLSDGEDVIAPTFTSTEPIAAGNAPDPTQTHKARSKDREKKVDAGKNQRNLAGKLNNLVTSDLDSIQVFSIPSQIAFSVWFLYSLLGWGVFVGFGTMIALFPVPGLVAKLIRNAQVKKMKMTDARVQTVSETMGVIRMVKLFGWEANISHLIGQKREQELSLIRKLNFLDLANDIINSTIPIVTAFITYAIHALVLKQPLTASKIFASFTVFGFLERNLHMAFMFLTPIIQAKVSLDRIDEFLHETELLDQYANIQCEGASSNVETMELGIRQTSFIWTNNETIGDVRSTPACNRFMLRIENEVFFKPGCINLVVGQTGSGKTSLLMALLGEMHSIPTGSDSLVSFPRHRGVAYHAQESWVLNETIRDNILFGASYDEERYNAVLEECALKPDLELFEAGDQTEVGERGLTLSGGQKARVTLARAIYSTAEILLLDDVLAALDVHTARWIVEKCLKGNLVRGRTVILVTHNIALTTPVADFVVSMGTDGRILSQGTLSGALAKDANLSAELDRENEEIEKAEGGIPDTVPDAQAKVKSGKLIVEEEIAEGHLGWKALGLLLANMGGKGGAILFWIAFLSLQIFMKASDTMESWVLALWSNRYENPESEDVPVTFYLSLYAGVASITVFFMAVSDVVWLFGRLRASRKIHALLTTSVLESTLSWLDRTPVSRILTRCTQDIEAIDASLTQMIFAFISCTLTIIVKFAVLVVISPIVLVSGSILLTAEVVLRNIYMKAQLPVKRESSNVKALVLGHFGAAMSGLVSIRAYGAQEAFREESYRRIDRCTRVQKPFWNLSRWMNIRMEFLSTVFVSSLALYLTYTKGTTASKTGFSFNTAAALSGMVVWWVKFLNLIETKGNSLERIQQYLDIDHEPKPSQERVPPAYWPASGDLRVENLSARYSHDGPMVLHDISFHVAPGERVGIVGRTGSGKSSLTLALLRAIITEGRVYYDGLPTDTLNLDALRSNITIIPQVPESLSGTLRHNLDPLSEHDDATLNAALRSAGLFSLRNQDTDNRLTLDSPISGGGSNLSVGQRQILALARALLRRSKILILDEATSAIDYETDTVIQKSLRNELGKDVTLLTIAHRLQTIMDSDKIMVLDAGRIVEFNKPSELLKNEKSYFRSLIEESGDKETLLAMLKST